MPAFAADSAADTSRIGAGVFIRRADLHKAIEALRAGGSDFPG
jgi:hypothetical protein